MKILYQCEYCEKNYDTPEECEVCERQGVPSTDIQVGDIVMTDRLEHACFGWFDGYEDWTVFKPGAAIHGINGYSLIYIVTAITEDEHRLVFHLETPAMTGARGYRTGRSYLGSRLGHSHCPPYHIDPDLEAKLKSKYPEEWQSVGQLATSLI